jgi:hypothetical protein
VVQQIWLARPLISDTTVHNQAVVVAFKLHNHLQTHALASLEKLEIALQSNFQLVDDESY